MGKRRENGTGSLVSKGKGKPWLAKWKYDGKVYYRSTGKTDREEALKELAKFVKPYQEETKIEVLNNLVAKAKSAEELNADTSIKKLMIDEVFDKFKNDISTADIASGTIKMYRTYWSSLEKFMAEKYPDVKDLKRMTVDMARGFLECAKNDGCPEYYNYRLMFAKRIWKMFGKEYKLPNIWEEFDKRKVDKGGMRREFTMEELNKIFETIKDDEQTTLLFAMGLYTGLRKGDCCKMTWDKIDFVKREIVIKPEKVKRHLKSPLHIPIHNTLYALLVARKKASENEGESAKVNVLPAWFKKDGSDDLVDVSKKLQAIFQKCGIEVSRKVNGKTKVITGFHSLRHTFVSMNINGGMNPMLVQKIVGHSTVNMTEHYFHQNATALRDGISRMPCLIHNDDVIDVQAIEVEAISLEKDVVEKLKQMAEGGDINETLRNLLGIKNGVKMLGVKAA